MKGEDQEKKITTNNVESYVRAYGKDINPERKAALLSRLDNQQSLFVHLRMEQSQARSRSEGQSQGRKS